MATLGSIAGCTSGGDGGDGGGDGDGGGGATTSTMGGELQTFTVGAKPTGYWVILIDIIVEENLIEKHVEPSGSTLEFIRTWEDVPQFVSGNTQIGEFTALEASRLGPNEDQQLTVCGKKEPITNGLVVANGSELDPRNTGGIQETIDMMVDQQSTFGIGSWGGAEVPAYAVAFDQGFDYTFKEGPENDFNVKTAGYFAMAELVAKGEMDAGSIGPSMGAGPQLLNEEVTSIFWLVDYLGKELGLGIGDVEDIVVRDDFLEENPEVVSGYVAAMNEAMEIFHEDPVHEVTKTQERIENLGTENAEQAEFVVEFGLQGKGPDHLNPPSIPFVHQEATIDQEWVDMTTDMLDRIAGFGLTNENWKEYVEFAPDLGM